MDKCNLVKMFTRKIEIVWMNGTYNHHYYYNYYVYYGKTDNTFFVSII